MLLHPLVLWSVIVLGALERGEIVYRPSPQESSVPERFRLKAETFWYELEPALATPRYTVSLLRFPSPITTPDVENNVVHAEFFDPIGFPGRRPAVVVLHILGSDFPLSRYMAARLADRGVAALFLKLPYYGERRPKAGPSPVPRKFLTADIERTVTAMRQGVCDVRRAICWLAGRPALIHHAWGLPGSAWGESSRRSWRPWTLPSDRAFFCWPEATCRGSSGACPKRPSSGNPGGCRAARSPTSRR